MEGYPLEGCKERSPIRRAARFQIGTVLFSSNSSSELVSTLASPLPWIIAFGETSFSFRGASL